MLLHAWSPVFPMEQSRFSDGCRSALPLAGELQELRRCASGIPWYYILCKTATSDCGEMWSASVSVSGEVTVGSIGEEWEALRR